jgi:hypothetical protein
MGMVGRARSGMVAVALAGVGCGPTHAAEPTAASDAGISDAHPGDLTNVGAASDSSDAADIDADAAERESTSASDADAAADNLAYAPDGGCQPGVPRCEGDFGYQMCQDDGGWGPPVSCAGYSNNGTTSYCVTINGWGYCVDPACWYWITHGFIPGATPVGVCMIDGTFARCTAGGTLAPYVCDAGCTQAGSLDGLALGYCNPACAEGAQECLGGPLYRVCSGGKWSSSPQQCPGGQTCNPVATLALPQIRCGGRCDPGTSRCSVDAAAVETCDPSGVWTLDRTCLLGRCVQAGQQAQCQAECAPGQHQCAYDGARSERSCGDAGLWNPEVLCPQGESCRMNGSVASGCVVCIGSNATGGNGYGGVDSTCIQGQLAVCGAGNVYGSLMTCEGGTACVESSTKPSSIASCEPVP